MRKNLIFSIIAVALSITTVCIYVLYDKASYTDAMGKQFSYVTVVIDAGHGGIDGGAVGTNGNAEKDINLAVALKLKEQLNFYGIKTIMTRETDISVNDKNAKTIKELKTSDLHNRMNLINSTENSILVSIHQNHFSSESSKGMQVFYSPNDEKSPVLADFIQNTTVSLLQRENNRQIKKATADLFLLYKAENPSVLVECGFISNKEENKKLQSEKYQKQLAFSIALGIVQYLNYYNEGI